MVNVVFLIVMLCLDAECPYAIFFKLSIIMLRIIMLSKFMLRIIILSKFMLSIIKMSIIMMIIIVLGTVMFSIIMLSIDMLSVVAPYKELLLSGKVTISINTIKNCLINN